MAYDYMLAFFKCTNQGTWQATGQQANCSPPFGGKLAASIDIVINQCDVIIEFEKCDGNQETFTFNAGTNPNNYQVDEYYELSSITVINAPAGAVDCSSPPFANPPDGCYKVISVAADPCHDATFTEDSGPHNDCTCGVVNDNIEMENCSDQSTVIISKTDPEWPAGEPAVNRFYVTEMDSAGGTCWKAIADSASATTDSIKTGAGATRTTDCTCAAVYDPHWEIVAFDCDKSNANFKLPGTATPPNVNDVHELSGLGCHQVISATLVTSDPGHTLWSPVAGPFPDCASCP